MKFEKILLLPFYLRYLSPAVKKKKENNGIKLYNFTKKNKSIKLPTFVWKVRLSHFTNQRIIEFNSVYTMIVDFLRFWYSTKPFQINIHVKTRRCYERLPWTWNNQIHEKLYKFYKTPQNLQSLGCFLVTLPFPMPESFLPPYETFAKRATTKSRQSLIDKFAV